MIALVLWFRAGNVSVLGLPLAPLPAKVVENGSLI
jgi:hypothetical protein